jgi:2-dehydro-3-deoxygluconokinase
VTFGEIMLRLSPPGVERFLQSPVLSATFGGGEANVAVSLAHFGCESIYVTRAPNSRDRRGGRPRAPRRRRPHRSHRARRLARGVYFAETGASQRASTVVYDRAHSAISELPPDAVN